MCGLECWWKKIIGVRLATWIAFKGIRDQENCLELPFKSNAWEKKEQKFKTEEDIWDRLLWFVNKRLPELNAKRKKKISIGQELWYGQFYDSKYIVENWMFELVQIVNTCLDMDIPVSIDLMSCPIRMIDYYSIIKQEIIEISL